MGDLPASLAYARQMALQNQAAWRSTPEARRPLPPRRFERVQPIPIIREPYRSPAEALADPETQPYASAVTPPQHRQRQQLGQLERQAAGGTAGYADGSQGREFGAMAMELTGAPQWARGIEHLQNNHPGEALPEFAMGALNTGSLATLHYGAGPRAPMRNVTPRELPSRLRVYHGSPHQFDEFDPGQIGTGEGAQAYGHGLYVAEADDVGQAYRQQLSGQNEGYLYEGYLSGRPSEFIDLDAPIARQPPRVQQFMSEIYEMPVREMRRRGLKPVVIGEQEARRAQDAGFAGLRYLDEGSRASGQGTRNYVVFDPSRVEWDVRNGALTRPPPSAANSFRLDAETHAPANATSVPPRLPPEPPEVPEQNNFIQRRPAQGEQSLGVDALQAEMRLQGIDGAASTEGLQATRLSTRDLPHVRAIGPSEMSDVSRYAGMTADAPPIIVRRDGDGWRIVDGHRRLMAARRRGDGDIAALDATPVFERPRTSPNAGPPRPPPQLPEQNNFIPRANGARAEQPPETLSARTYRMMQQAEGRLGVRNTEIPIRAGGQDVIVGFNRGRDGGATEIAWGWDGTSSGRAFGTRASELSPHQISAIFDDVTKFVAREIAGRPPQEYVFEGLTPAHARRYARDLERNIAGTGYSVERHGPELRLRPGLLAYARWSAPGAGAAALGGAGYAASEVTRPRPRPPRRPTQ